MEAASDVIDEGSWKICKYLSYLLSGRKPTLDRLGIEKVMRHSLDAMSLDLLAIILNHRGSVLEDKLSLEVRDTPLDLPDNMASTTSHINHCDRVVRGQAAQLFLKRVETNGDKSGIRGHHGFVEASQALRVVGQVFEDGLAFAVIHHGVWIVAHGDVVFPTVLTEKFVVSEDGW